MTAHHVIAFKRQHGMSLEDFRSRWAGTHAELVLELPGLIRYVQNFTLDSAYSRGREPMFDGIAEVAFEGTRAAIGNSSAWARVREDEFWLLDRGSKVDIAVEPLVVTDAPPGSVKLVMFTKRRPDLSQAQFASHWASDHAALAVQNPHLGRYVQMPSRATAEENAPLDGIGMMWFESMDEMRESGQHPAAKRAADDGINFLAGAQAEAAMLVHETVIRAGDIDG